MIRQFFLSMLLIFGIGLAAFLSHEVFVWAELDGVQHGLFVLYGLLAWFFRYGQFLLSLSVFRAVAIPSASAPLPDRRRVAAVILVAFLFAGGFFLLERQFGSRAEKIIQLQERYRSHSVVRKFRPGVFFQGRGFLFRPGVTNDAGYTGSLLVYTHSATNYIYLDSAVEVSEKKLTLQGGWRAGSVLQTNGNSILPLRSGALFTAPSYPLTLGGVDINRLFARLFSWPLLSGEPSLPVFIEGGVFTVGLFLCMAGGALFLRRQKMPVGSRFIAHLFAFLITAGPVFLLQYLQHTAIARQGSSVVALLLRGGVLFLVGMVTVVLGWRRYLNTLPPDVRAAL